MTIVKIEDGSWMKFEMEEILISLKGRDNETERYSQSADDTVAIKAAVLR